MREIVSPLDGFASPFGRVRGGAVPDAYAVAGFSPDLVFDFDDGYYRTGGSESTFDASITFARSSNATMVDSTGAIVTVGPDEPRTGHHVWSGSEWVNEGVLVESEARTNKITQSNNLATGWTIGSLTYAQNANGPLGSGTAYTITVTAGGSSHWWFIPTGAATGDQASSSFAKAGTASFLCISSLAPATDGVWFDLSTGTVGTENGSSYGLMEDFGGGWYRCTAIIPGAIFQTVHACVSDGQLQNFTAAGTETIFWCAAQLEAASTPSSYIPTSGNTVTRAADDADSDNLTYDSSAMWFTLSGLQTFADEGVAGQEVLFDWRADANNRITVTIDTDGAETGEITLTVVSGGTTWSVAQDYLSPGLYVPLSIAWRVTSSEINLAVGGTAKTAVSTTAIPDLSLASATFDGMGTRDLFRQGVGDIGDVGIVEASA